ncbi:hypothetical protein DL96DRAFT_1176526 [Flagelloscypha sp. PMI_526]|nr:hypothetical protein DL96DRAFT_1176526 [Flagelloscypha sp. PMI_526]
MCDTCTRNSFSVCKYAPPPPPPSLPQPRMRYPTDAISMSPHSAKQQISQRGVPRCDNCRQHNLKCDRALPICNVCRANRIANCTYNTSDPRSSGRCDRCQSHNLKCDRAQPTCNFCQADSTHCAYQAATTQTPSPGTTTPFTAHYPYPQNGRSSIDPRIFPPSSNGTSQTSSTSPTTPLGIIIPDRPPQRHNPPDRSSMSQSGARPTHQLHVSVSPTTSSNSMLLSSQSSHLTPPLTRSEPSMISHGRPSIYPSSKPAPHSNGISGASHPEQRPAQPIRFHYETESSVLKKTSPVPPNWQQPDWSVTNHHRRSLDPYGFPNCIIPWVNTGFIPLPPHILQRLSSISANDMPIRTSFNEHLNQMVNTLMPELRETASFGPEMYATIARGLQKNDLQLLTLRRRTWTAIHHVLSGSSRAWLLLMPRDSVFMYKSAQEQERMRFIYQEKMDITFPSQASRTLKIDPSFDMVTFKDDQYQCMKDDPEWMTPFERIPVQDQIYDVLAYAHRRHDSSWEMVVEVRSAGIAMITWPMCETFVRLCPICTARASVK